MRPIEAAKIITGIVVDDYLSDNQSRRFSAVLDSHLEDLVNLALVACGHNSRKDAPFSSFYVLADLVTKNAHYVGNWQFFDPGTTEAYLRETFKLMKARLGDDE